MERKRKTSLLSLSCMNNVADALRHAHKKARTSINSSMVYAYPAYLTGLFGNGCSTESLKLTRRFNAIYWLERIGETRFTQFKIFLAVRAGIINAAERTDQSVGRR